MGQLIKFEDVVAEQKKIAHKRQATLSGHVAEHQAPARRQNRPKQYIGPANRAAARALSARAEMNDYRKLDREITRRAPFAMLLILVAIFTFVMSFRMSAMMETYAYGPEALGVTMFILDGAMYGSFGALIALPFVLLLPIGAHAIVWHKIDEAQQRKIAAEDRHFALTGRFPITFDIRERERLAERRAQAV